MNWKKEGKYLLLIAAVFLGCFYLPVGTARFDNAVSRPFTSSSGTPGSMFCSVSFRPSSSIQMAMPPEEVKRPLWQTSLYFAAMIGILVFANWGRPQEMTGAWGAIFAAKWVITSGFAAGLALMLNFNKIMSFGVMMPPGLVVDGEVKCIGKVPTLAELKEMLK